MSSVSATLKPESVEATLLLASSGAAPIVSHASTSPASTEAPRTAEPRISAAGRMLAAQTRMHELAQALAQPSPSTPGADSVNSSAKGNASADAGTAQTVSASFSSLSTLVGIGTLNIEAGQWNGAQSAFVTNPNWPKANISVGPRDNGLAHIRDKINSAGVGVVAYLVTDATGSRLILSATGSGQANGFRIQAKPDAAQPSPDLHSLAALGFDPAQNPSGMTLVQAASDAKPDASAQHAQAFAEAFNALQGQLQSADRKPAADAIAQGAQQAVDTVTAAVSGPQADAWAQAGFSLSGSHALQWTDQGHSPETASVRSASLARMFADLAPQLAPAGLGPAPSDANSAAPAAGAVNSVPMANTAAGIRLTQQRLSEQYEQYEQPDPSASKASDSQEPAVA